MSPLLQTGGDLFLYGVEYFIPDNFPEIVPINLKPHRNKIGHSLKSKGSRII